MDEWTVGTSDAGLEQSQPLTWHRGRAQAYQVLWTEAARLVGDAVERGGASGEATGGAFVQPEEPVSSLLVLPGFIDQKEFKRFISSVTLGERFAGGGPRGMGGGQFW